MAMLMRQSSGARVTHSRIATALRRVASLSDTSAASALLLHPAHAWTTTRGLAGRRGTLGQSSGARDSATSPTSSSGGSGSRGASTPAPYQRASSTTISDVLSIYQADGRTFTCPATASLFEAAAIMVSSRVGCLVAMEEDGEHVAGLVTERDILSEMVRVQNAAASSGTGSSIDWAAIPVTQAMTGSREMVHIKPADSIDAALELMTSQGFRHLPVLDSAADGNHLRGVVSMRNLVDIIYKNQAAGGKAQFLTDILPRKGVPKNTALRKKGSGAAAPDGTSTEAAPFPGLFLNAGVCSIPHPDKKFGEDSFVAIRANAADPSADKSSPSSASSASGMSAPLTRPFSVLAVFDGVGSWSFENGLDPAKFSNALAQALKKYIDNHPTLELEAARPAAPATATAAATAVTGAENAVAPVVSPLSPSCMLAASWDAVTKEKIAGSSTACILSLGHTSNELRAANIGDSGFLVLRHRDRSHRFGSVGASIAHSATGAGIPAYQVVYRSPQQLHYFNCPLQIGISVDGAIDKFESPVDADLLSVPVLEGDVVVLASDGLFDNVPEERVIEELCTAIEAVDAAAESDTGDKAGQAQPLPAMVVSGSATTAGVTVGPPSPMQPVADALVGLAYRLSLDKMTDSPFAILAKDNNIMWKNGGRKDDITVMVARVDSVRPAPRAAATQ